MATLLAPVFTMAVSRALLPGDRVRYLPVTVQFLALFFLRNTLLHRQRSGAETGAGARTVWMTILCSLKPVPVAWGGLVMDYFKMSCMVKGNA